MTGTRSRRKLNLASDAVQTTPIGHQSETQALLLIASPQKVALTNVILKRKVKSLRKKLSRARIAFGRIMAETRE